MTLLAVESLTTGYGDSRVLHGVDLRVDEGEIVCLLGRNGVGKTTLLRAVIGINRAWTGTIHLDGDPIDRLPPYAVARRGVTYAAQDGGVFGALSVRENLKLGHLGDGAFDARLREVGRLFPLLAERLSQKAGTLSGGEQKMLIAGRALTARPRLALLDEVTEGLQPSLIPKIADAVRTVNEESRTAVLVVEQNIAFALSLSSRYYVMEKGSIVQTGSTSGDAVEAAVSRHLVL